MLDRIRQFIIDAQAYAKAIVAGAGTILTALAGLSNDFGVEILPAEAQPWITFALAILTAFATWRVPNVPTYATLTVGEDTGFVSPDRGISE